MENAKFSMNAFVLILIIFTAITLVFSVTVVNMAFRAPVDKTFPVEGTDVFVRYSSVMDSGIYEGYVSSGILRVKGQFGYEWGAVAEGNTLLINEYIWTDLGIVRCDLVRIDLETYEKTVVMRDAILRGRCQSGEAVCVTGIPLISSVPADNPLWKFYAISAPDVNPTKKGASVVFVDPATCGAVYGVWEPDALEDDVIESRYLAKTLDEVRK